MKVPTPPAVGGGRSPGLSMCGFLAVVNSRLSPDALRLQTLTLQRLVRHRGPDGSGIHVVDSPDGQRCSSIAHERLAIVDPLSGNQPLFSHDRTRSLAVNGEIYNHKELRAQMRDQTPFRTESDCEVIVHLYDEVGTDVASRLDGDFAFVILDSATGELYAARDPIGVNSMCAARCLRRRTRARPAPTAPARARARPPAPARGTAARGHAGCAGRCAQAWAWTEAASARRRYMGTGLDGARWFASEAKPLVTAGCIDVEMFPPGHYYSSTDGKLTRYFNPPWRDVAAAVKPLDLALVRQVFTQAVAKRLMADVPFGVLLSGGLDSSLVASVIARLRRERFLVNGIADDLNPLKSFSIGLEGSPDLQNAQLVADFIGTEHYGFTFTVQEGIDAVSDVIYHLETYDVTTIRAGTARECAERLPEAAVARLPCLASHRRDAHVPSGPQDQGDGSEDGHVRRRRGRNTRGVLVLPQGAQWAGTSRGAGAQGGRAAHVRLPPREQGDDGPRA